MSTLLIYRNDTDAVMAWAKDFRERSDAVGDRRAAWLDAFCDENGGPAKDQRSTFSRHNEFIGVAWPQETPAPKGWRRPAEDSRLIRPHLSTKVGKAAAAEMESMTWPDPLREISQRYGMKSLVLIPDSYRYYTPGFRIEHDGVWITWGSRDIASELPDVEAHGWVRVPLTEYIERFGEDAL